MHRAASGSGDALMVQGVLVPAEARFRLLLGQLKAGGGRTSLRLGGFKKIQKMTYCWAEAVRRQQAGALKDAVSISLAQDMRKSKLLVRYSFATSKLQHGVGFLGVIDLARATRDLSSLALAAGTLQILEDFCQPAEPPPHCTRVTSRAQFPDLVDIIKRSVENLVADAASDEQLGARILVASDLPNVKNVAKDISHASRRSMLFCSVSCDTCV